uniref:Uncharacterized protein n=1 Tax=Mimiviridae sp. ChoanoV1 TaxID=2596887 RepID=A0A5B8IDY0_9VIRU|nr:hypothetical protein 3_35 [Mimiviridae sp. ChoanoV1]
MTEIVIPQDLFTSIKTIIRYQNILLLKEIASDNNWNYMDLKKKHLKQIDVAELVEHSNSKKKKIKIKKGKKKTPKKSIENTKEVENEVEDNEEEVNEEEVLNEKEIVNEEEVDNEEEVIERNEELIDCKKYSYMGKEYYVNNTNVYDLDYNFIGRMINEKLNFDEEEI